MALRLEQARGPKSAGVQKSCSGTDPTLLQKKWKQEEIIKNKHILKTSTLLSDQIDQAVNHALPSVQGGLLEIKLQSH